MKKLILTISMLLLPSLCLSGWDEGTAIKKGQYAKTYILSVSSSAVSTISASPSRVDCVFRNDHATADVIVGTSSVVGYMQVNGFPIKAGEKFSPDGLYTGSLNLLYQAGTAATSVHVLELHRNPN